MEDLAQINKEIVEVNEFHDNVVAGRVCVDVLQNHKIPAAYLDVCRETPAILLPKSYRAGYLNT